jgi:hypothetical protein
MANKDADKDKKAKPHGQAKDQKQPKPEAKDKEKAKAKKAQAEAEAAAAAAAAEPKREEPRPPADPRLKYVKKFHGRFLPRGPLRDRHKALFDRWNSGEDHGGVTVDELKSLYTDWMAARQKPAKKAAV